MRPERGLERIWRWFARQAVQRAWRFCILSAQMNDRAISSDGDTRHRRVATAQTELA